MITASSSTEKDTHQKLLTVYVAGRGVPTQKYPLRGIFEFDQAKALSENGCRVVYLAVDLRSLRHRRILGKQLFKKEGVMVYLWNFPGGKIGSLPKQFLMKLLLKRLYKEARRIYGKADIIHAHFPEVGIGAFALARSLHIPFVYTEHFSRVVQERVNPSLKKTASVIYKGSRKVIAVSPDLSRKILEKYSIESSVVPNIVDTTLFKYKKSDVSNNHPFTVLAVGALNETKRFDLIISSFHQAFYLNSDTAKKSELPLLHLFGDGPQRTSLEKSIHNLGLGERVVLHGEAARAEIAEYMKISDCLVSASRSETFGVVLIEALAAGVPVISTKSGGPEHFIHSANGILVNKDDEDALSLALIKMKNYITSYDREYISNEIFTKFSPEAVSKQLIRIYRNC